MNFLPNIIQIVSVCTVSHIWNSSTSDISSNYTHVNSTTSLYGVLQVQRMTSGVETLTASAPPCSERHIVGYKTKTVVFFFFLWCRILNEGWKLQSKINRKCHWSPVWSSYSGFYSGVNGVICGLKWVPTGQIAVNSFRGIVFEIGARRMNLTLLWKIWDLMFRKPIELEKS